MPTITIKVSPEEKAEAEALAQREGVTLSEYVRRALNFYRQSEQYSDQLAAHDRRIGALEELAERAG